MPFCQFLENNSVNIIVIITDLQNLQFLQIYIVIYHQIRVYILQSSIMKLEFIFLSHQFLCVWNERGLDIDK